MAGPSGATSRLLLPYPIPDDTVDVPRDIQALASKLDGMSALSPAVVTALPTSPVDGQEVYYVADPVAAVVWHLVYLSATPGWSVLGGGPLSSYLATSQQTAVTTYTDLTTVGPQVLAPLKGVYEVTISAFLTTAAVAGNTGYMSYASGAAGADDSHAIIMSTPVAFATSTMLQRSSQAPTMVNAGDAFKAKYRSSAASGGNVIFAQRTIAIRPLWISP